MIEEYFESIETLLHDTRLAQLPEVDYDRRDKETGFLRGIYFLRIAHACISGSLFE
jgi:hypothetical protein